MIIIVRVYSVLVGLSLRAGRPGISSGYYDCGPQLLSYKNRRKIESKEIPSHLISRLLVVFTRQLEILVTTLGNIPHVTSRDCLIDTSAYVYTLVKPNINLYLL